MENTKAKKLIIVVLLVLLITCLAVIVWQYVRLNSQDSSVTNNTTTGNSQGTNANITPDVITNNNITNTSKETSNKETVVKYVSLVTDKINKYNKSAGKENCADRDMDLYLKVRIPQINVDATNAKKLNNEIYEKYKEYDDDNYTINSNKGGYDIDISYTYKYAPEKNILFIQIIEKYIAHCASGGVVYNSYAYDMKNDKVLTIDELLKLYGISEEKKQEMIDIEFNEFVENESSKEQISEYKTRLEKIEKNEADETNEIIRDISNDTIKLFYRLNAFEGLEIELVEY